MGTLNETYSVYFVKNEAVNEKILFYIDFYFYFCT